MSSTNETFRVTHISTCPFFQINASFVFIHPDWSIRLCQTLANLCENRLVLNVVFIVRLEFGSNAIESALESIFGRGVHHLGLYRGSSEL
jgi:hypothetical protein